jgi:hypothetical protein
MSNELEAKIKNLEACLADERGFGEIGRAVMRTLRQKGVPVGNSPVPGSGTDKLAAKYAAMGKDFDTLMEAIKGDVFLESEWDRFCMMLRLAE